MKKKTKKLLWLVILLVVLTGGYFALDLLPENSGAEEEDAVVETVEVTDFSTEDITFYCYYNSDYEMGFYVTSDGYVHYRDEAFPVKDAGIELQLAAIGNLTALQMVEGTDKSEYGLDVPKVTVSVTLADGTEHTYFVGDSALFEDADYLLDVENNVIYLVDSDFASEFNCSWSSMVQQEDKIEISSDQILDVTVTTAGVQTLYIAYDEAKEQPWQLTTTEGIFDGDSEAVIDAISIYNSYSMGTTIEYNCTDFAQYGLDDPITTVTVRYTEEAESNASDVKTLVFEFGNVDADSMVSYVRINGSAYVYGMTEYYAEGLSVFDTEELKYRAEEITAE